MSQYIKVSYLTNDTNQALMKCIMYIGKYYGKNKSTDLNEGITYLAKKVRGASKRSVRFMIYSQKIKNRRMRYWRFKKDSYARCYRYIVNKMLHGDRGNSEEAKRLLHDLFIEYYNTFNISQTLSEILVYEQKKLLKWTIGKEQYKNFEADIEKILNTYEECDRKNNRYV